MYGTNGQQDKCKRYHHPVILRQQLHLYRHGKLTVGLWDTDTCDMHPICLRVLTERDI